MSTSYWLYMHPELSGAEHYWKVGKSLTPYSAVRSRQRFLVNDFYLTALWFGHPDDIARLERDIHQLWRPRSEQRLGSSRRELIYYQPDQEHHAALDTAIEIMLWSRKLRIQRMHTGTRGYHATNSSQCCFHSAQEKDAHEWSRLKLRDMFNIRLGRARNN
jgi:hypothetical protein